MLALLEQTEEQAEGCEQQGKMGVSIHSLFQAGVEEGKIPDEEFKKVELGEKKQSTWFNPPVLSHPRKHSGGTEELE